MLVVGLALLCASQAKAVCTGADACVQQSTVGRGTSGADPAPTFGSNTVAGHYVIYIATQSNGGNNISVSGQGATWTKVLDSGTNSSGNSVKIFCGKVVTPGTTVTMSGMGATTEGWMAEFSSGGCNIDQGTSTAAATTGTSVSPSNLVTVTPGDIVFEICSHSTSEAVTFTPGAGFQNTNNNANLPTFNAAFKIPNANGTWSLSCSWTTTSSNSAGIIALNNVCTGADACKQQSASVSVATAGADNTPTLPAAPTAGNMVLLFTSLTNGTQTITPVAGMVDSWRQIFDTGSNTTTGTRGFIYCGIAPGNAVTSVTVHVGGGTSQALLAEFAGYTCPTNGTQTTKASSGSSSTTVPNLTTTVTNTLVVGMSGHEVAETVTDASTGFNSMNFGKSNNLTLNPDYEVASSTGTFAPSWSWSTSTASASGSAAFPLSSNPPAQVSLTFTGNVIQSVFPPAAVPNKGVFYFAGGPTKTCGSSLPAHTQGCSLQFTWAALEPQKGVYNWSLITNLESQYTYMQISILGGAWGAPTTANVCNHAPDVAASPTCQAWLGSGFDNVTGISVFNDVNNRVGEPCGVTLFEPDPHDATYQADFHTFISAFETQFSGDTHIALVEFMPETHYGFDMSLARTNKTGGGTCTLSPQEYGAAWATLTGCATNTCFENWEKGAFDTIWTDMVSVLHDQNLGLWIEPQQFPAIVNNGATQCSDKPNAIGDEDTCLTELIFNDANLHKPSGGKYYIANETLGTTAGGFCGNIGPYVAGADGGGAQPTTAYNGGSCTNLQTACAGAQACGAGWIQEYAADFSPCAAQIASCSSTLGGP